MFEGVKEARPCVWKVKGERRNQRNLLGAFVPPILAIILGAILTRQEHVISCDNFPLNTNDNLSVLLDFLAKLPTHATELDTYHYAFSR